MSRNIRRMRRCNDSYIPSNIKTDGNIETEGYLIRRIPKNLKNRKPTKNSTLAQRVSHLENEVADINVTLSEHVKELNTHEKRIDKLEKQVKKGQHLPVYPICQVDDCSDNCSDNSEQCSCNTNPCNCVNNFTVPCNNIGFGYGQFVNTPACSIPFNTACGPNFNGSCPPPVCGPNFNGPCATPCGPNFNGPCPPPACGPNFNGPCATPCGPNFNGPCPPTPCGPNFNGPCTTPCGPGINGPCPPAACGPTPCGPGINAPCPPPACGPNFNGPCPPPVCGPGFNNYFEGGCDGPFNIPPGNGPIPFVPGNGPLPYGPGFPGPISKSHKKKKNKKKHNKFGAEKCLENNYPYIENFNSDNNNNYFNPQMVPQMGPRMGPQMGPQMYPPGVPNYSESSSSSSSSSDSSDSSDESSSESESCVKSEINNYGHHDHHDYHDHHAHSEKCKKSKCGKKNHECVTEKMNSIEYSEESTRVNINLCDLVKLLCDVKCQEKCEPENKLQCCENICDNECENKCETICVCEVDKCESKCCDENEWKYSTNCETCVEDYSVNLHYNPCDNNNIHLETNITDNYEYADICSGDNNYIVQVNPNYGTEFDNHNCGSYGNNNCNDYRDYYDDNNQRFIVKENCDEYIYDTHDAYDACQNLEYGKNYHEQVEEQEICPSICSEPVIVPCPIAEPCVIPKEIPVEIINDVVAQINPLANVTVVNQPVGVPNNNLAVLWATRIGNLNMNEGLKIITDSENNVIIAGFYRADITSEMSTEESTTIIYNSDSSIARTISPSGIEEIFIAKYNTYGTLLWLSKIQGTFDVFTLGLDNDNENNIILTGSYTGSPLNIYNANNQLATTLPAPILTESYVVKYNPLGELLWVNRFITSGNVISTSLVVDNGSNIYVTGYYDVSSITFQNSDGTNGIILEAGILEDGFLVKYNSLGFVQWATRFGNITSASETGNTRPTDITWSIDQSIVIVGYYGNNTLMLYNSPNGTIYSGLSLTGQESLTTGFIIKYSNLGMATWATKITGLLSSKNLTVASDFESNIIVTGSYNTNDITFYNTPNGTIDSGQKLSIIGGSDVFVSKYNPIGQIIWLTKIAGAGDDFSNDITVDNNNNILITGYSDSQNINIYNADTTINININNYGLSSFLVKYCCLGNALWATKQENTLSTTGLAVTTDNNNNTLLIGVYSYLPLNIYNSNMMLGATLNNSNHEDAFIVKYSDFIQSLLLVNDCVIDPARIKNIKMGDFKNANTLITFPSGLLINLDSKIIRGFLLTNANSSVNLKSSPETWSIIDSNNILLIFP
ncbi:beta-propeller repeat protein [Moumouvirus australiensis]|uniref:Beta-propeller repeat protein n=1 Tax=Moumouvirus australiensis TaxID=2109587 RepID=A0A2P1ELB3_9VIRU|nr:beta-propeller repeat protein [Moumouvirus australiensis]AVL94686.1 beta-propeller repeat protein [Moumouvirus australiensis]